DLRRRGGPMPIALFVSAHEAPHRPSPLPPVTHLSDGELVAEMRRRYDGIPEEVLAEPELLELPLPVPPPHVSVLESYEHPPGPPAAGCRVLLLGERRPPPHERRPRGVARAYERAVPAPRPARRALLHQRGAERREGSRRDRRRPSALARASVGMGAATATRA